MSWGSTSHRWAPSGRARRARDSCWQLGPHGPARCGPTSVPPPALPLLTPGRGQAPRQSWAMGPRLWERAPQEQSLEKGGPWQGLVTASRGDGTRLGAAAPPSATLPMPQGWAPARLVAKCQAMPRQTYLLTACNATSCPRHYV